MRPGLSTAVAPPIRSELKTRNDQTLCQELNRISEQSWRIFLGIQKYPTPLGKWLILVLGQEDEPGSPCSARK